MAEMQSQDIDRIGCTMCHGVYADDHPPSPTGQNQDHTRLNQSSFARKVKIMAEAGIVSINYDDLAAWKAGKTLTQKSILIDFDHPVRIIWENAQPILEKHGYAGNLFINTKGIEEEAAHPPAEAERQFMTWDQIGKLVEKGWFIGAHTVNHFSFADMTAKDPSGGLILEELAGADETINRRLGITPKDLAYTGTSWSALAEEIVKQRYRFARLWITGRKYQVGPDQEVSESEILGFPDTVEVDGGPAFEARYITEHTNFYRIPSMELEYLLASDEAFKRYIDGCMLRLLSVRHKR